jgi:hypothetical protein
VTAREPRLRNVQLTDEGRAALRAAGTRFRAVEPGAMDQAPAPVAAAATAVDAEELRDILGAARWVLGEAFVPEVGQNWCVLVPRDESRAGE